MLYFLIAAFPIVGQEFKYHAASVLPIIDLNHPENNHEERFVLLGQEAIGDDQGYYADWGGSRDKEETDPLITAAREFYEEANGQATLEMDIDTIKDYLDPKAGNTLYIIKQPEAGTRRRNQVVYITKFTHKQFNNFKQKFYEALTAARNEQNLEKSKLCIISWSEFAKAIVSENRSITAYVIEADGRYTSTLIELRPILKSKLKRFFSNDNFIQPADSVERIYDAYEYTRTERLSLWVKNILIATGIIGEVYYFWLYLTKKYPNKKNKSIHKEDKTDNYFLRSF